MSRDKIRGISSPGKCVSHCRASPNTESTGTWQHSQAPAGALSFLLLGDDPQCSLWDVVGRGQEPATGPGALPSSLAASVTFIGRWDLSFEILTDFPPCTSCFPFINLHFLLGPHYTFLH